MTYMAKVMHATEFASWLFDNGHQIFNIEEKRTIELQELIDLLNIYSKHLETKGAGVISKKQAAKEIGVFHKVPRSTTEMYEDRIDEM